MKKEARHKLGSQIRKFRRTKGITQTQLAEIGKMDYKYVQEIEGKNPPNIRLDTLMKIAKVLKVPAWKLLQFKN